MCLWHWSEEEERAMCLWHWSEEERAIALV